MITVEKVSRWVAKPSGRGGRSKFMYEAKLGDMVVDGNTAAEAKTKLLERAAAALRGDDTPVLIRYGAWIIFIWRRESEWGYKLIDSSEESNGRQQIFTTNYKSKREAERAAMNHLAQTTFDVTDPLASLEYIDEPDERAKFLSWASWQVRYRVLVDAGYEGRPHETSSGLERWPEHIDKPAELVDPLLAMESHA